MKAPKQDLSPAIVGGVGGGGNACSALRDFAQNSSKSLRPTNTQTESRARAISKSYTIEQQQLGF